MTAADAGLAGGQVRDADDCSGEPGSVNQAQITEPTEVEDAAPSRPPAATYGRVVVAILCVVGVQIGQRPINDNSFLTHLATGRLILDSGSIPGQDPYSFSAHGEPWTVQSWLASVIYASVETVGGMTLLRLLMVALTVALLLLVWRLTAPAASLLGRVLPVALLIVVGNTYWSERPLMFGLIGLALVLLAADDGFHPAWLIPVMWVWVNTHGSFPFAPAVLGLLVIGRWLDRESAGVELRATAWCVAGIALAAINPLGPKLLIFPLGVLERRDAFTAVVEWQAPSWGLWSERAFAVLAIGGLVALLMRRRKWRSLLPLLVFSAAAAMSMRNIAPAAIVVVFAMAPALTGLGRVQASDRRAINGPASLAFGFLAVVFLVVGLAGPDTNLDDYPTEAVAWMETKGLTGPDLRVLSSDATGNYLEARLGPEEVQVYIDDRVDMFPMAVIDDYLLLRDEARTDEFAVTLDRIDPTLVLWEADTPLGRWLLDDDGWTVTHQDDEWLVAVAG